jgi:hypothetical protein
VEELLLPDGGGWDEAKLNNLFFDSDVADIHKIPLGRASTGDYVAWNYNKNGFFFLVKSAYHLNSQIQEICGGRPSSSRSCDEHREWLALWSAEVSGKEKFHT